MFIVLGFRVSYWWFRVSGSGFRVKGFGPLGWLLLKHSPQCVTKGLHEQLIQSSHYELTRGDAVGT